MQQTLFDRVLPDDRSGFRLKRLELFNWGTFHKRVWHIDPNGSNSLLTGEIGSGKSTLVDAITTLFVPQQKIVYNKAAGAGWKDRTLLSYILGEYKDQKDEGSSYAKPVALREKNTYTVLLAVFWNGSSNEHVTLAQVFWLKEDLKPDRFFVAVPRELSVKEHFSVESTLSDLRKSLRAQDHLEILNTYKEYSSRYRKLLGIGHEQAIELFNQTVSLKSVGNLTDFVRSHMLEEYDIESRIQALRENFDNLNQAHEAILKAKKQIELLLPIQGEGERHSGLHERVAALNSSRDSLAAYFAERHVALMDKRLEELRFDEEKLNHQIASAMEEIRHLTEQETNLAREIERQGGGRIEQIEKEIARLADERKRVQGKRDEYEELAGILGLSRPRDEGAFSKNRLKLDELKRELETELGDMRNSEVEREVRLRDLKARGTGIEEELKSLRGRPSNIPLPALRIRNFIAEALRLEESGLPFAGELIRIEPGEEEWEGAIERLMHSFGLSLLVAPKDYAAVSEFVNRNNLKGRLVYFSAFAETGVRPAATAPDRRSVVRKIRIKHDTAFHEWIERELLRRFDYVCCDSIEEFRRLPHAVTRAGQIRAGGRRHEKDDRSSIHDRSKYVLGWSNEEKIRVLEQQLEMTAGDCEQVARELSEIGAHREKNEARRDGVRDLLKFAEYSEIHWEAIASRIEQLSVEIRQIEESSDLLATLREQLDAARKSRAQKEDEGNARRLELGRIQEKIADNEERRKDLVETAGELLPERREKDFPKIDAICEELFGERPLNLRNIEKGQSEARNALQSRIDAENANRSRLAEKIVKMMGEYRAAWPAECTELDASIAALPEYCLMLQNLLTEDLPRHEERFKSLLKKGTINNVALFQQQLEREKREITEKIEAINRSLKEIDYENGSYIRLVADISQDREVREFQHEIRECLAETLGEDSIYTEPKFLQVKKIIERFNGRPESAEIDRVWTKKVTDVRNWFDFSASERWRADDSEREHYSDSSGKSGGQKEKLAYTVLAAALAYQYGLEWNETRSRSFRFVVIDEAFGRGSDESARYGLELFKKLNLQLLVVTPLQKLHIIEDYVSSVHFVHKDKDSVSMVQNLTMEEYRIEQARWNEKALAGL